MKNQFIFLFLALVVSVSSQAQEKPGITQYPKLQNFISQLEAINATDTGTQFQFFEKTQVSESWLENCEWIPVIPVNIAKRFYNLSDRVIEKLPQDAKPSAEATLEARQNFRQMVNGSAYKSCQHQWTNNYTITVYQTYKGDSYRFAFGFNPGN